MAENVKVSVFCLTYNHEKYLRRCLDGFVMQKTTFSFEVLVHDDASTDGTAEIIREYAEKYPAIIKPTYQTENQYSKGVGIIRTILLNKAQGEYLAWCEGDDCWTDSDKLQKQVAFLDTHPEYSCCYHRVLCNNLRDNSIRYIPNIERSRDFDVDEIIKGGALFQLSAIMIRSEFYKTMPEWFTVKGAGDFPLYIYAAMCGKCHVLSDVMSMYNHGTEGSWTERVGYNKEKNLEHEKRVLAMFYRINEHYDYRYNDSITYAIDRAQFNIHILCGNMKEARKAKYREFYVRYKNHQRVYFVRKYFPILVKIKQLLKRGRWVK